MAASPGVCEGEPGRAARARTARGHLAAPLPGGRKSLRVICLPSRREPPWGAGPPRPLLRLLGCPGGNSPRQTGVGTPTSSQRVVAPSSPVRAWAAGKARLLGSAPGSVPGAEAAAARRSAPGPLACSVPGPQPPLCAPPRGALSYSRSSWHLGAGRGGGSGCRCSAGRSCEGARVLSDLHGSLSGRGAAPCPWAAGQPA